MSVYQFFTMSIQTKFSMSVNIFHVYSATQNRDKTFGTLVKIIHQRVSVLRHSAILRQHHLSNRHCNMEIEHICVIKLGM